MALVSGMSSFKSLLAKDFGPIVFNTSTYDAWLKYFLNTATASVPASVGDMSFEAFATLPVAHPGFLAQEINSALQVAKTATASPSTVGTLQSSGERMLTSGHDMFRGGLGADRVDAGNGNDVLDLGAGNDTAQGGGGNDLIFGEAGSDSLIGGAGNDTVFGGADRDILHGWNGNDVLFGGSGNDGIYGNEGNDTISGGDGNDYICGGSGNDVLLGGLGADTFAFRGQAAYSVSVIKDFQVLVDRQLIMASVVDGPLNMEMISSYSGGLKISFDEGREIRYEGVWDTNLLFSSLGLFD